MPEKPAAINNVFERRDTITKGLHIKWEAPILRHFTVALEME
jgi:tryptophanase